MTNKAHDGHNILGHFCWTCQLATQSGIPGWPKAPAKGGVRYSPWTSKDGLGVTREIIWANGDIESKREGSGCAICKVNCEYPVNRMTTKQGDNYREISVSKL